MKINIKIKALIPVRGGSERVKNKNIRPFHNKSSLLEIKIRQLQDLKGIDSIVVNSEDPSMLSIASDMGCETVKRDPFFASSEITMSEVYKNMAQNIDCDYILYCNVTNPLVSKKSIQNIINKSNMLINSKVFKSINTCTFLKEFIWDYDNLVPINYNPLSQVRSQDLPNYVKLNFAVNLISKEAMINWRNIITNRPALYPLSQVESIDIDTMEDFEIAGVIYDSYLNPNI